MARLSPEFDLQMARDARDVTAAQGLRYRVFVTEMGGTGAMVDHAAGLERDRHDPQCDHLLLIDRAAQDLGPGPGPSGGGRVVAVCRLMDRAGAAGGDGFASAAEFDLAPILDSGRSLLELGRTCVDPAYRGGTAMYHLWHGLAGLVRARGIDMLFGTASFPGRDPTAIAAPLAWLAGRHRAPQGMRVRSRQEQPVLPVCDGAWTSADRRAALLALPALIKAYLRLGGVVGDGVFVDHNFGTTDVCMLLDVAGMSPAQRSIYARGGRT